jgi:hypothetical protein
MGTTARRRRGELDETVVEERRRVGVQKAGVRPRVIGAEPIERRRAPIEQAGDVGHQLVGIDHAEIAEGELLIGAHEADPLLIRAAQAVRIHEQLPIVLVGIVLAGDQPIVRVLGGLPDMEVVLCDPGADIGEDRPVEQDPIDAVLQVGDPHEPRVGHEPVRAGPAVAIGIRQEDQVVAGSADEIGVAGTWTRPLNEEHVIAIEASCRACGPVRDHHIVAAEQVGQDRPRIVLRGDLPREEVMEAAARNLPRQHHGRIEAESAVGPDDDVPKIRRLVAVAARLDEGGRVVDGPVVKRAG